MSPLIVVYFIAHTHFLQLQAEIKIHRTLKHNHVCMYKHYFEDRNNCYILLELCHNQSLNEMIKRRKRLTEPEAAYFMKQLMEAVRYMHGESVIHRDLKLGNLFLDRNMHIKVGDLGLATRVEDRDEKRKTICGTPNYIAPEVIQGDKSKRGHSFEVDVWSMGVILYTILVGKPPYEAKDVKATYHRILANEYSFPSNVSLSHQARDLIRSMLQTDPKDRPSLELIECHPFLTDIPVPESLPGSVLHRAPVWQTDDFGVLVIDQPEGAPKSAKSLVPRSSRQPFASRNPNASKKAANSFGISKRPQPDTTDPLRVRAHNSVSSNLSSKKSSLSGASPGFRIFDESPTPQPRKTLSEETLVTRTKALSIASPDVAARASLKSAAENEGEVLRRMVEQLDQVLTVAQSGTYPSSVRSPRSLTSSRGGPTRWVSRYVDYTSKYGLGFLLNDNSAGVYFNDSTKTVLEPVGETFQYIERKRDDGRRSDVVVESHSLSNYPDSLKKKVTLLTHFRNYLLEQQKKTDQVDDEVVADSTQEQGLVYVKKWMQTKHAILFRLSDQTIQVVFYDQTEVLLTPDTRYVTYVDKNRRRATFHFTDELLSSSSEVEKRLKYSKEILQQLLSSSSSGPQQRS